MRKKFEGRTVFEAMRGAQSTAGTCRSNKFIVGRMDEWTIAANKEIR